MHDHPFLPERAGNRFEASTGVGEIRQILIRYRDGYLVKVTPDIGSRFALFMIIDDSRISIYDVPELTLREGRAWPGDMYPFEVGGMGAARRLGIDRADTMWVMVTRRGEPGVKFSGSGFA